MQQTDETPKNQHYVPQFLLRNFSVPLKKSQICVFDKTTETVFVTNIRNVCSETGFYDFQVGDGEYTMEPSLMHLESSAAQVVKRILTEERLPKPDSHDRALLAIFVATQFLRVKTARTRVNEMNELLKMKLESVGTNEADIKRFTNLDAEAPKFISMGLLERIEDFVPFFFFKTWILLKSSIQTPLLISDNPVNAPKQKNVWARRKSWFGC